MHLSAILEEVLSYRPTEAQMPWAYQRANPKGRPLSDDWGLVGKLKWLQPWQLIPRRWRAWRIPLPLQQTSGPGRQVLMLGDPDYPRSPGTKWIVQPYTWLIGNERVTADFFHVMVDVAEDDGFASFAAFVFGQWRNVFWRYHRPMTLPFVGRGTLKVCFGCRPDVTASPPDTIDGPIKSDWMAWFPEWGCTFVKES